MIRYSQRIVLAAILALFVVAAAQAQVPTIGTYAGGGLPAAGPATATGISDVGGIAFDPAGNLYFVSFTGTILKMDTAGNLSIFAGTGPCCFSGDGGPATSAKLTIIPFIPVPPLKTDPAGNVYFVDYASVVRRIDHSTGIITTVAGTPNSTGFSGAGGPATSAQISPSGLAFDAAGDLYIADNNNVVWRVDHVTQIITIVAGNGTAGSGGDGGPATSAQLNLPDALAFDAAGDLFIAQGTGVVRKVDALTQTITTVAGGGNTYPPNGVPATQARLGGPTGLAFDLAGNLLIADPTIPAVLRVDHSTQNIAIIAGNTALGPGFSGDGGPATSAQLGSNVEGTSGMDLAVDTAGDIFVTDAANRRVRRIDAATGFISTVAGNGTVGDGGPATSAFMFTGGLALDPAGNLLIDDIADNRIRSVNASTGIISTVAGRDVESTPPPTGNGGLATAAQLNAPRGLASDSLGDFFFNDSYSTVRKVDGVTGIISLYAGNGATGFSGDGGPATSAELDNLRGVATDAAGDLFIADDFNNVVRRVDVSTQIITTVAGNTSILSHGAPAPGYSGDGGPATLAQLDHPASVFVDAAGDLFISDAGNGVIRRVDAQTQIITTVAGDFSLRGGFSGDNGPALSAALHSPQGLTLDSFGNLYFSDAGNYRVRMVNAVTGIITTLAGNGNFTFAGDGGPAASSSLYPYTTALLAVGPDVGGNIRVLVGDGTSGRTRVITIPPVPAVYLTPPAGLTFTTQVVGTQSSAQYVTIANSGTGTLNVANIAITGTDVHDFILGAGGTCTGTSFSLAPTASCTVEVTFAPYAAGTRLAALTFTDNAAPGTHSIPLSGAATGVGGPVVTLTPPGALTFGPLAIGATATQSVNVQNTGNAVMTFTSITISGAGFALGPATTCPLGAGSLGVGGNCTLSITFAPLSPGTVNGQVTLTDDAAFGPQTISIFGSTATQTITQPLSPSAPNQFNFGTHNFTVQYPAGANFSGVNMTVSATQTTSANLQQRFASTPFANAVCIVYDGSDGNCVDYQVTCTDMAANPIACPSEPTATIVVKTSFDTQQAIINPGFLTAPIGTNNWTNIFDSFFLQRIDPTVKGKTTGFSEFVAVSLGATNAQGLGVFQLLPPLSKSTVFGFGQSIPVKFQLTSLARPGTPVTDAVAGISVEMLTDLSGNPTPKIVLAQPAAFVYHGGMYQYNLSTLSFAPGVYSLTIYGNAFVSQQVQVTISAPTSP